MARIFTNGEIRMGENWLHSPLRFICVYPCQSVVKNVPARRAIQSSQFHFRSSRRGPINLVAYVEMWKM